MLLYHGSNKVINEGNSNGRINLSSIVHTLSGDLPDVRYYFDPLPSFFSVRCLVDATSRLALLLFAIVKDSLKIYCCKKYRVS